MTVARVSQVTLAVLSKNETNPAIRVSQADAEILSKNQTNPAIKVSQINAEVLSRNNIFIKAVVSQITAEVLSKSANPTAYVSQVVAEVIHAERTLLASFTDGVSIDAGLVLGTQFSATNDIPLTITGSLGLGGEFAPSTLPISVSMTASLEATSLFSAINTVAVTLTAALEEGIELNLSSASLIKTTVRAALTVHPEQNTSRFFLLF